MEALTLILALVTLAIVPQSRRGRRLLRVALRPLARVVAAGVRRLRRSGPTTPTLVPVGRPIEVIARDLRRLGLRYRTMPPGLSFAKSEGIRRAYDGVLAEACDALEVTHLLRVLPVGDDLDAERRRVETVLHIWGVVLDDAA